MNYSSTSKMKKTTVVTRPLLRPSIPDPEPELFQH